MSDLLRFVIALILIYVTARALHLFIERTVSVIRLLSLRRKARLDVRIKPSAFFSVMKPSRKRDAEVEIGDETYLIRFLSGRGSLSYVHFASERFAVVYSKIHFSISGLLGRSARRGAARQAGAVDTSRQKVHIIEKLTSVSDKRVREVIILDPVPAEVTYVTETKTAIRAAYTGDEVYGRMIFTPETFVIYADRKFRELEYEMAQKTH